MTESRMTLQASWNLDSTSNTLFSVSRGLIQAATSDNVSAVAVNACLEFGDTIAMCQETCSRIETHVIPTRQPAVIEFLKATVGYSKHDCVPFLGSSLAGVRFLALASVLISSMNVLEGARTLDLMLRESANKTTSIPPLKHLKEFLATLETRCYLSTLADTVVGWEISLNRKHTTSSATDKPCLLTPTSEGIAGLVHALRAVFRLGDSKASKITIHTAACTAGAQQWAGMVNIACYGQWILEQLDLCSDSQVQILKEILPYAIHQAIHFLRSSKYQLFDSAGPIYEWPVRASMTGSPQIMDAMLSLRLSPFPELSAISRLIPLMFDSWDRPTIQPLKEGTLLADLPLVDIYLQALEDQCMCFLCAQNRPSIHIACMKDQFFRQIARIVADILALSLFRGPSTPLIWSAHSLTQDNSFVNAIYSIFLSGSPNYYELLSVQAWVHSLVGHDSLPKNDPKEWVMSCYKGKVIYPSIFDNSTVQKHGYLSISCLPGFLRYEEGTYSRVQSSHERVSGKDPITPYLILAILSPT